MGKALYAKVLLSKFITVRLVKSSVNDYLILVHGIKRVKDCENIRYTLFVDL